MTTIEVVLATPYFLSSVGFLFASGILVGAGLFNGHLPLIKKVILACCIYGSIVLIMNLNRINEQVSPAILIQLGYSPGLAQLYILGIASVVYFFGMLSGVYLLHRRKIQKERKE